MKRSTNRYGIIVLFNVIRDFVSISVDITIHVHIFMIGWMNQSGIYLFVYGVIDITVH